MAVVITLKDLRLNGEAVQPGTMIRVENEQKLIGKRLARRLTKEEAQSILANYAQTFEKLMEDKLREIRPCRWCGGINKWESIYGAIACSHCRPPLKQELVKRWIVLEQKEGEDTEQPQIPGIALDNNISTGGIMKLLKHNTQFEKVKVGEFVPGKITRVEYDMEHKFYYQGIAKESPGVRFVFELQGYKYQHKSGWMKLIAYEKAPLYKMYISKLVENVEPSDIFELDVLIGMEVKTIWANDKNYQVVESVEPIGKKIAVTIEKDGDGINPELEAIGGEEEDSCIL